MQAALFAFTRSDITLSLETRFGLGPMSLQTNFKMADRKGLMIWTMFTTAKYKVRAANNALPVLKMFLLNVHRISAVGDERFGRYGCPEPGKLYDFVTSNSCQCDAAQVHFPGKKW